MTSTSGTISTMSSASATTYLPTNPNYFPCPLNDPDCTTGLSLNIKVCLQPVVIAKMDVLKAVNTAALCYPDNGDILIANGHLWHGPIVGLSEARSRQRYADGDDTREFVVQRCWVFQPSRKASTAHGSCATVRHFHSPSHC